MEHRARQRIHARPGPFLICLPVASFPTTTWLRSRDSLEYTPEPDIFHDVFGHVPMHAHRSSPISSHTTGSSAPRSNWKTGAEATLERIGRLFWYTVEFGLIRQHGRVKVYGSGLISSNGECTNVLEGHCKVQDFSLEAVLSAQVQVDKMHKLLFAIESFDQIYESLQQVFRPSGLRRSYLRQGCKELQYGAV